MTDAVPRFEFLTTIMRSATTTAKPVQLFRCTWCGGLVDSGGIDLHERHHLQPASAHSE